MSVEALEKQIQLANLALERANRNPNMKLKGDFKEELSSFEKILEKSKARLRELEAVKKQCDYMSACREIEKYDSKIREAEERAAAMSQKRIGITICSSETEFEIVNATDLEVTNETELEVVKQECDYLSVCREVENYEKMKRQAEERAAAICAEKDATLSKPKKSADDDSDNKRLMTIPWLEKEEAKKEEPEGRDEGNEDNHDEREEGGRGMLQIVASFGSQIIGGNADIATVSSLGSQIFGSSEITRYMERDTSIREGKKARKSEPRDDPDEEIVSPEYIAEQELKARENYIKASKDHQALKKQDVSEDSHEWKLSEKKLRDCYAQIEYWECLQNQEESTKKSLGPPSIAIDDKDPYNLSDSVLEAEEQKARKAYLDAMIQQQNIVNEGMGTHSKEWIASQARLRECLANLHYWESLREYAVPPTV